MNDERIYRSRQVVFDFQCDQDFDNMPVVQGGKHCAECNKVLTDFTGWKAEAIFAFMRSKPAGSVCGIFTSQQVQPDIEFSFEKQYERLNFTKRFFFILLFVFGTSLFTVTFAQTSTKQPVKKTVASKNTAKPSTTKPVTKKPATKKPAAKKPKITTADQLLVMAGVKQLKDVKKPLKIKDYKATLIPVEPPPVYVTGGVPYDPVEIIPPEPPEEPTVVCASPLDYADEMPEFPGGHQYMMSYINRLISYPTEAMELGISGKVYVRFVVETDGKISNPVILKSPHESLSREVMRLLGYMPSWKPGKHNGRNVRVSYVLPVKFTLK